MRKILIATICLSFFAACNKKTQYIQDQTEAINDSTQQISEELADESVSETPKDSLSAKK